MFVYIYSSAFYDNNRDNLLFAALKRLQESGASYFVLDLKDNLGGLVQVC